MSDRDRDLSAMDRLRAGDPAALEELYDRHGGLLYSVVLKIVQRPAEAEDVLQEAWFQVWKRCDSYDPSRGPVVAWLVTVAKSRAIDRYRSLAARARAEDSVSAADAPPRPADPPATAAHRQLHEHVTKALATLTAEQRQCLELAYFGGLSQSEVAAKLGAPLGTVKSWTRQALLKLRDLVPREEWA